jgi:phosphoglycerate dehydrogenase-like enzyme
MSSRRIARRPLSAWVARATVSQTMSLAGTRVGVTGGAGFLGSHVAHRRQQRDATVGVLRRRD